MEDVEPVDLRGVGPGDRPGERALLDEPGEVFAALGLELLRIGETADAAAGVEDDGGGHHRSGERPAPGLVDPDDHEIRHGGYLRYSAA